MKRLLAVRLVSMLVVLAVLSGAVFLLQAVVPADPVRAYVGASATTETVEAARAELGYDQPLAVQYRVFMGRLAQGDLGTSLRTRSAVRDDLAGFLPATLELAMVSLALGAAMGTAYGLSGVRRRRGTGALRGALLVVSGAPVFLLALGGIYVFYGELGWLPATGRLDAPRTDAGPTGFLLFDTVVRGQPDVFVDAVRHLVLPATVLALAPAVAIGRTLRSSLESGTRSDWYRTARAKGLDESAVLRRHALRNAAGPALAMTGLQFGILLAGVIVVETIFAWPGLGYYVAQSIPRADFPAVAGVTLVLGVAFVVINTVVDVLQALADPRIETL